MTDLDQLRADRFKFLHRLCELTKGDDLDMHSMYEIGRELSLDHDLTGRIEQYLVGEGLVEDAAMPDLVRITHAGVRHVENALQHPERPTQYFPPVNVIRINHMVNSSIQQASPSAVQNVTLDASRRNDVHELIAVVRSMLPALPLADSARSDLEAECATIEPQLASSRPKGSVVRECLSSIRTVLEGTAGNVIAQGLITKLAGYLG